MIFNLKIMFPFGGYKSIPYSLYVLQAIFEACLHGSGWHFEVANSNVMTSLLLSETLSKPPSTSKYDSNLTKVQTKNTNKRIKAT